MDIKSYLQSHSNLRVFKTSDQQAVLNLAAQAPMKVGGIELVYDRSPDYQALLRCQGDKYLTVISEELEKLLLVYSLSTSKKWIDGELVDCAYIGDFRTNQSGKAALIWRKHYAEFLRILKADSQYKSPKYILTAILKKNAEALRNLATTKRDLGFRYDFLAELNMVNVYGQWPWSAPSEMRTIPAQTDDRKALLEFLGRCEKNKIFGANFQDADHEWKLREENWPNFSIENFLIQKDSAGEIVACTLPWDPGFAKRMTVTKAPRLLRFIFKMLTWIGFSMPKSGESLKALYLTHLNVLPGIDESKSVQSFVQYALKNHKNYHMVSFADEVGIANRMQGLIIQKVPVMLYTVALTEEKPLQTNGQRVSFEMGLV